MENGVSLGHGGTNGIEWGDGHVLAPTGQSGAAELIQTLWTELGQLVSLPAVWGESK